jgi:glycogen synthase
MCRSESAITIQWQVLMRVLISHFTALGSVGGVETVVRQIAQGLQETGIDVAVVEVDGSGTADVGRGVSLFSTTGPSIPTWTRPRSWASTLRSARQLLRVTRRFRPDIINVQYPVGQSIPLVVASHFPHDWSIVPTLHNSDIRVAPQLVPALVPWQRRLFQRAQAVTAVSSDILAEALTAYPEIGNKGCVVHNGLEQFWFEGPSADGSGTRSEPPYVLCAGRFHTQKGVDVLLHAWDQIRESMSGTVLWLVGQGPQEAELRALADRLALADSVRFSGFVAREQLRQLHRDAAVVVMPSRYEGFPLTLLEAGASGAICVASDVSGVREIIRDGTDGFVVPPESADALAAAILTAAFLDPTDRARMSATIAARMQQQFAMDQIVNRYCHVFESVLRSRRRSSGS